MMPTVKTIRPKFLVERSADSNSLVQISPRVVITTEGGGVGPSLSDEYIRDLIAGMLVSGDHIQVVNDDAGNTITFSLDSLTLDDIPAGSINKVYTQTEKTKLAGVATNATANSPDATLLNRQNHTGTQSADTVTDGTTNKVYTATEKTKLSGVATGATANSTDATLLNRANHTGTQSSSTISDFTEAAQDAIAALLQGTSGVTLSYNDAANTLTITGPGASGLDAEAVRDAIGVALVGTGAISVLVNDAADTITISTTATQNDTDANLKNRQNHTGTQSADTITDGTTNKVYTATEKTKLSGIANSATANSSDATLLNRTNHTGTQLSSTISDLSTAITNGWVSNVIATGQYLTIRYNTSNNTWPDITTLPAAYVSSGLPIIWDSIASTTATAPAQARNGDYWDKYRGV